MCVALFSTMTKTSTMKTVPIATTASESRSQTNVDERISEARYENVTFPVRTL